MMCHAVPARDGAIASVFCCEVGCSDDRPKNVIDKDVCFVEVYDVIDLIY